MSEETIVKMCRTCEDTPALEGKTVCEKCAEGYALRQRKRRQTITAKKYDKLIPRKKLMEVAQANAESSNSYLALALLLQDRELQYLPLHMLLERSQLKIGELIEAYQKYWRDVALVRSSEGLPNVMTDIMVDSRSTNAPCARCEGTGYVVASPKLSDDGEKDMKPCYLCKGTGNVRKIGDTESRKLALEAHGLIGKRGPLIAQQFNIGDGGTLESVLADAGKAIEPRRILEAEVKGVPAPKPEPPNEVEKIDVP